MGSLVSYFYPPPDPTYHRTSEGETYSQSLGPPFRCPLDPLDFIVRYPNRAKIESILANPGIYTPRMIGVAEKAVASYPHLVAQAVAKGWIAQDM
jgi:hypothetical protein